jgi:hypothetical protein
MEKPMTLGIEPTTFWLVVHCLNQLCCYVPLLDIEAIKLYQVDLNICLKVNELHLLYSYTRAHAQKTARSLTYSFEP